MSRILVVDDEENLLYSFEILLSREGHEVVTVRDFESAVRVIEEREFDLIITDIILNGRSGVDILEKVSALGLTAPVVMITGQPSIETAAESVRLGAFDYIPKPVDKRTLYRVTRRALQHKALLDNKARLERENQDIRKRLEAIFQSVQEAIVTVDGDMRIVEANRASEHVCGFDPETDYGKRLDEMFGGCAGSCLASVREVLEKQRPVREVRVECRRARRPEQVVVLNASPLRTGEDQALGAVMVARDITRVVRLEQELARRRRFANIVGESPQMEQVYRLMEDLAETDTTVLITGESGTGKELVAEALHMSQGGVPGPLVKVNCQALSENLLESELFGHVRGAFTGAVGDKIGRFQMADGGTIFLDEIGDLSPRIQVKLLRVLQEKEFERVGDAKTVKVNVRVIAATNRDLKTLVARGRFREDLYYRLKVVEIVLPPLRERKGDVSLLIDHFRIHFNRKFGKNIEGLSVDARDALTRYDWPGNVRELKHAMEHAAVRCHGETISLEHLPPEIVQAATTARRQETELTSRDLSRALRQTGGNKSKAASLLGVSRPTLYRKLREFGLD